MKPANDAFSRRLQARLHDRPGATSKLHDHFGISSETIRQFRLGLSEPYPKLNSESPSSTVHKDVLVAPLCAEDGRFYVPYIYQDLPGVTVDNRLAPVRAWCTGPARTYYSRKTTRAEAVFVCSEIADVWAVDELLRSTSLGRELVVIAPTPSNNGVWPTEWESDAFWATWKAVIVAFPEPAASSVDGAERIDAKAMRLTRCAKRDVRRLPPIHGTSWTAALIDGLRVDTLRRAIQQAQTISPSEAAASESGRYVAAESKDLSSSYHNGFLYETIRVVERDESANGKSERYKDLVVRSDRTLHSVVEMPSPPGTSKHERVLRLLPDGTQLQRVPTPSPYGTWHWTSVQAYVFHRSVAAPLTELLGRLNGHLRACVWLPRQADYSLLSCVAVATYCQQIFDAVPLVLVTGVKESGKTELGIAMSEVCANSPSPIGVVSAATMARLIDMTRGFVVIDDLEKVMAKRSGESQFSDLVQALKLSYKKQSAFKLWTDTNNGMRVERLNFFGIKLINNTAGVDEILGSRMVAIGTRPMPPGVELPRDSRLSPEQCAELRDQLHTWAFSHVKEINRAYCEIFPNSTNRSEEIAAPIRVIAKMAQVESVRQDVNQALNTVRSSGATSPSELMEEAIQSILVASIRERQALRTTMTVEEVRMKMLLLEGPQFGKSRTTDVAEIESPEWIGRQFRQLFAESDSSPQRFQMYGRGMRAWTLHREVVDRAITSAGTDRGELQEISDPRAFCRECAKCDYASVCNMRERRQ